MNSTEMPRFFVDRVQAIVRDSERPLRIKDVAREYAKRGWPLPAKGKGNLRNNVGAALSYLRIHKRTIERNDNMEYLWSGSLTWMRNKLETMPAEEAEKLRETILGKA